MRELVTAEGQVLESERSRVQKLSLVLLFAGSVSCGAPPEQAVIDSTSAAAEATASGLEPIGLGLFFRDGSALPLDLGSAAARFIQELDIVASVTTETDQGVTPLSTSGDLADLDWSGISLVEEDWRPAADGSLQRQRFYRGARWMEQSSLFILYASSSNGVPIGTPIVAPAGSERPKPSDAFFVRRFVARQVTTGCTAVGDCSAATSYTAQGLVQLREATRPGQSARSIPPSATRLNLFWSAQPGRVRSVDLTSNGDPPSAMGFGFQPSLEVLTAAENGNYYLPGQSIRLRATLRDAEGRRLHEEGELPTYADFLDGGTDSGLHYFDPTLNTTLYYALKKREGLMIVSLSGPTDRLKVPLGTVGPAEFFAPQVPVATTALDGYSAVVAAIPPVVVMFGGDPNLWSTPVSDEVTFTIPSDALPGTYVLALKARRDFAGEPINRGVTTTIQVGTAQQTVFAPQTRCTTCHRDSARSSLNDILHGLSDRRACYSCHAPLFFEPDNALDFRVHFVHSRSERFPGDVQNCSLCHTAPPSGPARGLTIP